MGAGSAGWLTALVLSAYCPYLKIRLIRPRANTPIGVGESTQPDLPQRLQAAGVDLADFCTACDATIKCGIFYRDWNVVGDHYWHPFTAMADGGSYTAAHHYQQMILEDPQRYSHADYYSRVHTSYETCVKRNLIAPEAANALHVDAAKLAAYLERHLQKVEVIESERIEPLAADGRIVGIGLDDGKTALADLYVDCTGFARAVLGKIARPVSLPYEPNVNRAVAANVPYVDRASEMHPYTRAHAHEHGWTWSIPLRSRIGSGYVYHGDFCTPEQAEKSFRAYWGEERMRDVAVRHISFDHDTLRHPWVANVVAIGLSAGFVEPLEATGLNWTISSADLLTRFLGGRYFDDDASAKYNALMLGYIRDVQDFVDAHYLLSSRRDGEFWRHQTSRKYPERLMHRLALYAAEMPNQWNRVRAFAWAFNEVSWIDILNGYAFEYAKVRASPEDRARAQQALEQIAAAPRQAFDPRTFTPVGTTSFNAGLQSGAGGARS
ncbi:MAG TPA: tryptophan 7-halogenase [Gammaproteobacteria bacterium]|nr:tryptophan 7-halogenase [Gammaproteobacteria bacterium]